MTGTAFSPALQKFIDNNRHCHEEISAFFRRVTRHEDLSRHFLALVLSHKRNNLRDFKALYSAFGSAAKLCNWIYRADGYYVAYQKYMLDLWNKASRIEDILQFLPNFNPWCLSGRFNGIRIGNVPEEFGGEDNFITILDRILNSPAISNYCEIKRLECVDWPAFTKRYPQSLKVDIYDFDQKRRLLCNILEEECGHPFELAVGGKTFTVKFLCNPFSCKIVCRIISPDGAAFILKSLPFNFSAVTSDRQLKEHENHALRADSPYSNALLEFYLRLNRCPHAPDICYYNYLYDSALYREEKGTPFNFDDKPYHLRGFYDFNHRKLADANRLGIYVNDISGGNFMISARDNKLKIIDIGHAGYSNPLNPGITGLCFSFGNLCGHDYIRHLGSLFL